MRELRQLKGTQAPPEAIDGGRIKLMAFMASHPMSHETPALPWWQRAFVWKPAVAAALTAAVVGGGGAVYAAGSSMPGDSLYGVKLLTEEVRNRLTLSPESQFNAIAEQAQVRLDEVQLAMEKKDEPKEVRDAQVHLAMANYQAHVDAMAALAVKFKKDDDTSRAAAAVKAVEKVLERHENLVDSTSSTTDDAAEEDVVAPMKPALELEAHVMDALTGQNTIEKRVQERADRLRKRWEKFQQNKHPDERMKPADSGDARQEADHDSHEHPEQEAPKPQTPPAASGRIRVETEAGQDANINTNDVENAVNVQF